MNEGKNDIAEELLVKHLAGETTPLEEQQVLAWIAESPQNATVYDALRKVFLLSQEHYAKTRQQDLAIDVDREWSKFVGDINNSEGKTRAISAKQRTLTPSFYYKIAAGLFLLFMFGWGIRYFVTRNEETLLETADVSQIFTLPDGTHVTLNKNSQLAYDKSFNEESRTVTLIGEGFFEVSHNKQKPFIINVNHTTVEVVGTSFDIQGYGDRKKVEVTVQTGIVKFSVPGLKNTVTLTAGDKGVYDSDQRALTGGINKNQNFLAWSSQKLVFSESNLKEVIETLNAVYQTDISLSTDVKPTCVITTSFDHQTLDAVLHVLESTLNLTIRRTGEKIEITHAGC